MNGACGTGRPAWLPEEGDIVRDATGRTGRVTGYLQSDHCTPRLSLEPLDGGSETWVCDLSEAAPVN